MKWRNNPVNVLHEWWGDGSWVIFNEASGQTHVLSLIAYDALGDLSLHALAQETLAKRLFCLYPEDLIPDDPACDSYLTTMINDLDGLGLVEPCNL